MDNRRAMPSTRKQIRSTQRQINIDQVDHQFTNWIKLPWIILMQLLSQKVFFYIFQLCNLKNKDIQKDQKNNWLTCLKYIIAFVKLRKKNIKLKH